MIEREEDKGRGDVDELDATEQGGQPMAEDSGAADGGEATPEQRDERDAPRAESLPASDAQEDERAPLLAPDETERFRRRWEDLQTGFVDRPKEMVEEADDLVGELMQQLTTGFNDERSSLEAQWEKGEEVSTEELRVALTRYRSFFNRLLSA
jgi:hypothetical protein